MTSKIEVDAKNQKEILKLREKLTKLQHKLKMEELSMRKDVDNNYHQRALERIRIKSAEIRRSQERKEFSKLT